MPSKILAATGTVKTWADSGGDAVMTLASLATGGGRQGGRVDLGAGSIETWYRWLFFYRSNTTPTVNEAVRLYLSAGNDTSHMPGALGASDAAVTPETKLNNCEFLGSVEVDEASTSKEFARSGLLYLKARYVIPVVWNATGVALHATAANNGFWLWPVADESQ